MKLLEISDLLGVTAMSVHRYRKKHPKLNVKDEHSKLGHPFPEPTHKEGSALVWDREEVMTWYIDNRQYVGARAPKNHMIEISYQAWCIANAKILKNSRFIVKSDKENKNDDIEERLDDLDTIVSTERIEYNDMIRIKFKTIEDAVLFKLKYAF